MSYSQFPWRRGIGNDSLSFLIIRAASLRSGSEPLTAI